MEYIFEKSTKRKTTSLDGEWAFCTDKEDIGETEKWYEKFPEEAGYINVPSCWNNELGLYSYVGRAWYKKEFYCDECCLQLSFGAVTGKAVVYLDGVLLGEHYGGWLEFSFEKLVEKGCHTVTVMVDNTPNDLNTFPLKETDWCHFGGITRSVTISEYKAPFIKNVKVSYQLSRDLKNAILSAEVSTKNPFQNACAEEISFYINGELYTTKAVSLLGEQSFIIDGIQVENINLWEIGKGNLYDINVTLENDDYCDKIGFRKIEAKNKNIYLNGKPIFLKGVNRHELHPDWCFAVPTGISKRDVDIIKDLNCNFVRMSHYPQSHQFVEYLDREGMVAWCEIPMWQFYEKSLSDEFVTSRARKLYKEMVDQYYNHPSIIIWGLHNEVQTDTKAGYNFTKMASEYVREMDNSRLISFASDRFDRDISFEFADIVALNNYFGWYYGTEEDWEGFIKGFRASLTVRGLGDKPVMMSEFGVPALYGNSSLEKEKWSMEYQADYIANVINLCEKEEGVCGTAIWVMADFPSDKDIAKARGYNNKGILNEYRKPKLAYYTVKELYKDIK